MTTNISELVSHLVTLENYAKRKKKSLKTIYNWIAIGKLEVILIDGKKFLNINR